MHLRTIIYPYCYGLVNLAVAVQYLKQPFCCFYRMRLKCMVVLIM